MSLECFPVLVLLYRVKSPNCEKVLSHSSQLERFLSCISYLMSCHVTIVCECLVTLVTLEMFLSCNTLYGLPYVLSSDQSLWMSCYTGHTWKVSLLCGLLYVLSGHQSLWMPCYTERFLPCVKSHMSCQSPGHNKYLVIQVTGLSPVWVILCLVR